MKKYDAVVVGGSLGGVLSAYSLAKKNHKVLLIEETDWIGGQLTSQGVPSDEHDFIEKTGCTKTYREYRNKVREYYRNHENIIDELKSKEVFNPGNGWVSKNAHEPVLAHKLLNEMLEPFNNLDIWLNSKVIKANFDDFKIYEITVLTEDKYVTVSSKFFIDATDNGDLLPITNTKYVTGAESFDEYNEPHAPKIAHPLDMQPITWVAAISYDEGGNHLIEKPAMYDLFKSYQMPFNESVLSWYAAGLDLNSKRLFSMFATKGTEYENTPAMFTYRQILEPKHFKNQENVLPTTLLNWPQNDYFLGNIIENNDIEYHKYAAKQLTLSLIYWLQTEAKRCDGKGFGYPEIMLSPKTLGTSTGLAKAPYIRESRRIKALYTIKEQDINKRYALKKPKYFDSVGVGLYHIDLHMTTETKTYFFDETWPFEIPLGALIPETKQNLIAGCKNIGTTHVTNGCYRLHPIEWNIGEVAGLFVSYCLENNYTPHEVYKNKKSIKDFQDKLILEGVQLEWPDYVFKEGVK
ncbi:FAD-dependent oxidoreductase [Haploplasma axanthum]|uniref:FAD dependent oxidoreductase n=1 Tax=Haploplasma axanthum TaxID=29552 RepID=A0A449BBG9_HAPAX|nr:FAD-dependent oxidoreductase [Haploplasma axanthum]VEU79759.1 FAD dependent oxidoreductase [Haploplasma axanthum]